MARESDGHRSVAVLGADESQRSIAALTWTADCRSDAQEVLQRTNTSVGAALDGLDVEAHAIEVCHSPCPVVICRGED